MSEEMQLSDREKELAEEMEKLGHAMQTGIMYMIEKGSKIGDPKHLRTGINSALVFNGTVVKLLVKKGLITREEYAEAAVEDLRAEVKQYEKWLAEIFNVNIKLG